MIRLPYRPARKYPKTELDRLRDLFIEYPLQCINATTEVPKVRANACRYLVAYKWCSPRLKKRRWAAAPAPLVTRGRKTDILEFLKRGVLQ
jgi:hypothetical protein